MHAETSQPSFNTNQLNDPHKTYLILEKFWAKRVSQTLEDDWETNDNKIAIVEDINSDKNNILIIMIVYITNVCWHYVLCWRTAIKTHTETNILLNKQII